MGENEERQKRANQIRQKVNPLQNNHHWHASYIKISIILIVYLSFKLTLANLKTRMAVELIFFQEIIKIVIIGTIYEDKLSILKYAIRHLQRYITLDKLYKIFVF